MPRAASFTEAQITRAVKGARAADPLAVIEVTREGVIRILPPDDRAKDFDFDTPKGAHPKSWEE